MKKKFVKIVAFLALLLIVTGILVKLTVSHDDYRNYQWIAGFYEEPEDSLDVVFIGGSNVYAFFEAPLAWEKYGITVWPYACNSQPFLVAEYALKEAVKTQPNAIFVISINGLTENVSETQMHYLLDYMPFSKNKLDLVNYMTDLAEIRGTDKLEYLFPFIRYHSRWDSLTKEDFHYTNNGLKGGSVYSAFLGTSTDVSSSYRTTKTTIRLYDSVQESLNSLLDYCDENHLQVVFVTSPQARTDEDFLAMYNTINSTVEARGYDVLDLLALAEEVGVDWTKDYYNGNHTNIHGAIKVTDYVSRYLVEQYGLSDKRGSAGYESWDEAYELYLEQISPYVVDGELDAEYRDYTLAAPKLTGLTVVGTTMTLKWDLSEGADGYKIYRKVEAGSYQEIADVNSETNSYEDINLTISNKYTYTVMPYKMINGDKYFGDYDYAGKTETALMDPPTITDLSGEENRLTLTWEKVNGADGYVVRRQRPGRAWVTVEDVEDSLEYVDNRMSPGMSYKYSVRAYTYDEATDTYTYGSWSTSSLLWLGSPESPIVQIKEQGEDAVTLEWQVIEGLEGFSVLRKTGDEEWETLKTGLGMTVTEYKDSTVEAGQEYRYKVVGYIKDNGETIEITSNEIAVSL